MNRCLIMIIYHLRTLNRNINILQNKCFFFFVKMTFLFSFFLPGRDPQTIERANLLNVSKLIIKELIDSSLSHGRMLDDDHVPLQQFFVVLEHVLRHGLKRKSKSICRVFLFFFDSLHTHIQ